MVLPRKFNLGVGACNSAPNIAVGADGNLRIAWLSHSCRYDRHGNPSQHGSHVYVRSFPTGASQSSSRPQRISQVAANGNPRIFTAGDDMGVVWTEFQGNRCYLALRILKRRHNAFVRLAQTGLDANPAVATDGSGVWIAFQKRAGRFASVWLGCLSNWRLIGCRRVSSPRVNAFCPAICAFGCNGFWCCWIEYRNGGMVLQGVILRDGRVIRRFGVPFPEGQYISQPFLATDCERQVGWLALHLNGPQRGVGIWRVALESGQVQTIPAWNIKPDQGRPELHRIVFERESGLARFFYANVLSCLSKDPWVGALHGQTNAWSGPTPIRIGQEFAPHEKTRCQEYDVVRDLSGKWWMVWVDWSPFKSPMALALTDITGVMRKTMLLKPAVPASVDSQRTGLPQRLQELSLKRYQTTVRHRRMRVYFGDLHVHSRNSFEGWGRAEECFTRARAEIGMDFCALTDHDVTMRSWRESGSYANLFDCAGSFVALLGIEDRFAEPCVGDKVFYFFDQQVCPTWSRMNIAEGALCRSYAYALYKNKRVIIISHDDQHGICDLDCWDEKLSPVVQISSSHCGSSPQKFECFLPQDKRGANYLRLQDALKARIRLGVVGGSDNHAATPQIRAALYLANLSRAEIYRALRAKRCYALTGRRINLDFRVDGFFMGATARWRGQKQKIFVAAAATTKIIQIDIIKNFKVIATFLPNKPVFKKSFTSQSESPGFLYARVFLNDNNMAWSSPIWFLADRPLLNQAH